MDGKRLLWQRVEDELVVVDRDKFVPAGEGGGEEEGKGKVWCRPVRELRRSMRPSIHHAHYT